ncbi:unnamed protein product [Brassica rapa subsp. narinosa]|uniref:Secreted protein n=1 Tax=Brassica oleracea TaxID=3712 RepID=A0A3P6AA80_BRAOL|nr:unnamed protein product [Brassica oleracea]
MGFETRWLAARSGTLIRLGHNIVFFVLLCAAEETIGVLPASAPTSSRLGFCVSGKPEIYFNDPVVALGDCRIYSHCSKISYG